MIYFDSDYMEGAHPEVMEALMKTNLEHTVGYGNDHYTKNAKDAIRKACNAPEALVQFLIGGTQTNATVIDALLRRHEGVLAAETAHINVHESGAIEHSGHKILTLKAYDGKVCVDEVDKYIEDFYRDETYEHMVAPGMLYITQPTEYGTLYSLNELEQLSSVCHKHNIPLYMDGARLGYALASPAADFTLADIARLCDVFYIGGTKCGLLFGEAVVAPNPQTLPHFFPLVKQHGALCAKGRIQGVQFLTLFSAPKDNAAKSTTAENATATETTLYKHICNHAIELAQRIRNAFGECGYKIAIDSPTNQQFFVLPNELVDKLRANGVSFEDWGPRGEEETTVRFVCSWATTDEDVNALIELVHKL
ncbi:MAG: aminotransferase class I/II-fold pyridoxal phosphate-dependent enzyme [Prevotellaceae bacterium]|nr:aminotransferase class I/II-fold pyridoxal phosphate-dependent enzyme [Candidatus Colivivens equi]